MILILVLVAACAPQEPPCTRELSALRDAQSDRQHGFTQNDDVREAFDRLQEALACVDEQHIPLLLPHARQLHARLALKGNVDELTSLAKILSAAPQKALQEESARISDEVRRARSAREPLVGYAQGSVSDATTPDAQWRAQRMMEAAGAAPPSERAGETRAFITHVSSWESCLVVLPGSDLPAGTALTTLQRAGISLPLHGDPPAFPVNERTARTIRLCSASAFSTGDTLRITVNGTRAFESILHPTTEDEARGAAILALGVTGKLPAACNAPSSRAGRLACGWAKGTAP